MNILQSRLLASFALAALPFATLAAPPSACDIITAEDINPMLERKVEKTRPQKSGNPSECGFLDSRNGAVATIYLKEVQYAVKDEFDVERGNLEKIYRVKAKNIETVGEAAFWLGATHSMWFRKGRIIGSVKFETPKNQNESETGSLARLVESRIK